MSLTGAEKSAIGHARAAVPGRTQVGLLALISALGWLLFPPATPAAVVAADNADNDPYPVTNLQPGDNGGYGFTPWRVLESGTPGARFVTPAIDDGRYSWGLNGTYALGRGLASPLMVGSWRVLAVHDSDNRAFSGFSLKASPQPGLATGELLRFGINPRAGNYQGGGIHVSTNAGVTWSFLDCGWRAGLGDSIEYLVTWSGTGAWWLTVSNLDERAAAKFAGVMSPGAVAMLGVAANGSGLAEGLTFDRLIVESESENSPRLTIRRHSPITVAVSWPAPASGWYLQHSASLTNTNWMDVTQSPQPTAEGWQVILPNSPPPAMFYRLKK